MHGRHAQTPPVNEPWPEPSSSRNNWITTTLFGGDFIAGLPLYVPERKTRTSEERVFIDTIRRCHGVIIEVHCNGCAFAPLLD